MLILFINSSSKAIKAIVQKRFMDRTLLYLIFYLFQLFFDCLKLLLAAHIIDLLLVHIITCLYLWLYFFALIIKLFYVLYQFSKLSGKLFLLQSDFT